MTANSGVGAAALASTASRWLRRGELLALRIGDFDPEASTIRIERALEQTKAGLRIKPPKTKHGRRTIALPPTVTAELRAHILRMQEQRLSLGMGRATDDDLLFPRWDGQIRSPHWLTQKFDQLMESLKIDGPTFHSVRHAHASQLIASGMDVLTISRRLGHGSPNHAQGLRPPVREHRRQSGRDYGSGVRRLANRMSTRGGVFASKPLASSGRSDEKPQ